jgi:hypothetical protein
MNQKLITVTLLLIAAISLIYIVLINDWISVVVGLIFATTSFLSASFLLFMRYKKQSLIHFDKL